MNEPLSLFDDPASVARDVKAERPGRTHRDDPATSHAAARVIAVVAGTIRARLLLDLLHAVDGGQQKGAHGAIPADPIYSTSYGARSICTICVGPCCRTGESGDWTHNRKKEEPMTTEHDTHDDLIDADCEDCAADMAARDPRAT